MSWLSAQPESGVIEPGGNQTVYVRLQAPEEVGESTHFQAELRLSNDTPYGSIDIPVSMTVVPSEYGLAVTPDHQTGAACQGESAAYTLLVRNTGQSDDTYDVGVDGLWEVSAPATIGPLAAGEQVEIEVQVEVPSKTKNIKSDLTTLTFSSQEQPGVTAEATLLTEVIRTCE